MKEAVLVFFLSCAAALAALVARIGLSIGNDLPPEDAAAFAAWKRKRVWTIVAEFSALPAFAAAWTAASYLWALSVPFVVLGSMASGALGFGFLLQALQAIVTRRIQNV
ncbi:MAG TPA: hypothetical protein VGB54_11280 [Allosphingosinicella sp.]|jgi:hypothetical protein